MKKCKIKKCWVIERYHEYCNDKKLLAIFDARTNSEKIMSAMKTLMMAECDNIQDMLLIKNMTLKDNQYDHPHFFNRDYPVIIGFSSMYYKAPYKAWITEINLDTGEYVDIETMFLKYPSL